MSCRRPNRQSCLPRPMRLNAIHENAQLGPDPYINHILNAPDEEMNLYADSAASYYNPDAIDPNECDDELEFTGYEQPYTFRPDFRIPERLDGHITLPIGPRDYPEPGEHVTGWHGGPFGRHGRNDWGEPFVTDDFYTDPQEICDPRVHTGMLFQGHIPPVEPPDMIFEDYIMAGQRACDRMVREAEDTGVYGTYPMSMTPAWCDFDGEMDLALPGDPGYVPLQNLMTEEDPDAVPRRVHTIYNPVFGPRRTPHPSEPTTGFGGPFTDNREMPWGPESYMTSDFGADACDSGEHPGMRFPAEIPPQQPTELDFGRYRAAQERLMTITEDIERTRGIRFSRSHPVWRGPAAPGWSETGEYEGPPC